MIKGINLIIVAMQLRTNKLNSSGEINFTIDVLTPLEQDKKRSRDQIIYSIDSCYSNYGNEVNFRI